MDNYSFTQSFRFYEFSFSKFHKTDSTKGTSRNFIGYLKSGHAQIVTDEKCININTGDFFYIPDGCRYTSFWYGNPTVSFVSLAFKASSLPQDEVFPLQRFTASDKAIEIMNSISLGKKPDCTSIGLFYYLLSLLYPYLKSEVIDPHAKIIQIALQHIENDPHISVGELAKLCHISESGFYSLFKKVTGKTPVVVKQSVLASKAVTLLTTTNMSVESVSENLGFSSPSYFRKVLRATVGKTPREIRNNAHINV